MTTPKYSADEVMAVEVRHTAEQIEREADNCQNLRLRRILYAYAATLRPQARVDDGMVDRAAKAIFEHWRFGAKVPWVDGGNSLKQDDARDYAHAAIAALQAQPAQGAVGTPVDCIGLALDLEQHAKRAESRTMERAMFAAAIGLRRLAHPAAPVGVPDGEP